MRDETAIAVHLRPWQLAWRADHGISGVIEPEVCEMLMQLMLTEGFLSDPNTPGVEKLAVTLVPAEFLDGPAPQIEHFLDGSDFTAEV